MSTAYDPNALIHHAAGQWVIELFLASGCYSDVYRAIHAEGGRQAVIKVVKPNLSDQREGERSLGREEEALNACSHQGIPKFIRRCEIAQRKAIIISYCPGQHMLRLVKEVPNFDRVGVLRAVARLLKHVHERGYVHADVCLENILMAPTGRVSLTGFSHARRQMNAGTEILTRVFRRKTHQGGPFTYLAPEIMGAKSPTPCSDVFAFGVAAFLMLTKHRPYRVKSKEIYLELAARKERADILRHYPHMPRSFAAIINRCLTMDPAARIQNGSELVDIFDIFFAQKGNPTAGELSRMFVPEEKKKDDDEEAVHWID